MIVSIRVATGQIGGFSAMPMPDSLKEAVDAWCREQIGAYRASRDRIRIDANSAEATMRDHIDRWILELIQNAEDAGATRVKIKITPHALYFADDGRGLSPAAVRSISALHLSDKPPQAIGRKGLGFKAVYSVTNTPSVFTGADGIHFDPKLARDFLESQGFVDLAKTPFSWLPHWRARHEDETQDEALRELRGFQTVVRLPLGDRSTTEKASEQLATLQAYTLLTFRHLRRVEIESPAESRTLEISPRRENLWAVKAGATEQAWSVLRCPNVKTPAKVLAEEFPDPGDRARCERVSLLVATLLDETGMPACVQVDGASPRLHVFYPTEIPAPVDLVLHAEFVTKSDRTAIIPLDGSPFNHWLAQRMAECVVKFVEAAATADRPEAGLLLLAPTPETTSEGTVTQALWEHIASAAKTGLSIPNSSGRPVLRVSDAIVFGSGFPGRGLARGILARTGVKRRLVHARIEDFSDAVAVLVRLGGQQLRVDEVLASLEKLLPTSDAGLLWEALDWLSQWLHQPKSAQGGEAMVERIARLKVIALEDGTCVSKEDLCDALVTWRDGSWDKSLPDWMPLRFIAPWLKDRLETLPADSPIERLLRDFGLKAPSRELPIGAFGRAIKNYWSRCEGMPARFWEFLEQAEWDLEPGEAKHVERCPVRATVDGKEAWIPACEAYFGTEWDNSLLVEVYRGVSGVGWLMMPEGDKDARAGFFETLGVRRWPRLIEDTSAQGRTTEQQRVGVWGEQVSPPITLDRLTPSQMSSETFAKLLCLLAKHWIPSGFKSSFRIIERVRRSYVYRECNFLWWEQVLTCSAPCRSEGPKSALNRAWLPEENIRPELRALLPILDATAFGEHWPVVRDWLRKRNIVHQSLAELSLSEWRQILQERMPSRYPASAGKDGYQAAIRCYETALLVWNEQQTAETLSINLLARCGDEYAYVEASQVWLADDSLLEQAFASEVWLISFSANLHGAAIRRFNLRRLSQRESRPDWTKGSGKTATDLNARVRDAAPYILAKRSNDAPAQRDQFLAKLRAVEVRRVGQLLERVSLPGIDAEKKVERRWALVGSVVLVSPGNPEANLGEALAALLERESDADLYEILLGCDTNAARRSKLEQRGVPGDHLDGCLTEFHITPEEPVPMINPPPEAGPPAQPAATSDHAPAGYPGRRPPADTSVSAPRVAKPEIELQEPNNGNWRVKAGMLTASVPHGPSVPAGNGGGSEPSAALTAEQKHKIEVHGRNFCEAELKQRGYAVKQMPFDNPGYDLEAERDGELLRLEVKAHRGRAAIVDLTEREWQTYLEARSQGAPIRWQLWNVENLNSGTEQVVITTYDNLPEEALRNSSYRLDLRRCDMHHPSEHNMPPASLGG